MAGVFTKTHIEIDNVLGGALQARVHCRNNLNVVHEGVINNGQSFRFEFTLSGFEKVWYCHFGYNDGVAYGILYQYPTDYHRCCKNCSYSIAKDGVHRYDKHGKDEIFLNWEKCC